MSEAEKPDLTNLTVQLLSAYVSNNTVASNELAELIRSTRVALESEIAPAPTAELQYVPAVTVRKSLGSRDHIISLIDGKLYKSLKRHLSSHGLTPAEYRARYNLPSDYPMVAPGYSQQRREVAQRLGLGNRKSVASAPVAAAEPAAETAPPAEAPATIDAPLAAEATPAAIVAPVKASRAHKAKSEPVVGSAVETEQAALEGAPEAAAKPRKPRPGKLATVKAKLDRQGEPTAPKQTRARRAKSNAAPAPEKVGGRKTAKATPAEPVE
ncbi:MucR family transcriptional regulator [Sphingomonas panacis]|nr:MucR family transcriptional regulator [Sphingomonas panacis]